jgi:hypothetical protein
VRQVEEKLVAKNNAVNDGQAKLHAGLQREDKLNQSLTDLKHQMEVMKLKLSTAEQSVLTANNGKAEQMVRLQQIYPFILYF